MDTYKWHKKAEKEWDDFALTWTKNSQGMWEGGSRKNIIPFFSQYVPTGVKVVDLGCGDGMGSLKLAQAGYNVTGIDFSQVMIELAEEKSKQQLGLTFIQGDFTSLPFNDEEMEAAMVINSLEFTGDPLRVLREIHRIIKPGGHVCFGILGPTAEPRKKFSFDRLLGEEVIMNTMQPWEFENLALASGWKPVAETGVGKRGIDYSKLDHLSKELKQAVSFMWLFIFQKEGIQ